MSSISLLPLSSLKTLLCESPDSIRIEAGEAGNESNKTCLFSYYQKENWVTYVTYNNLISGKHSYLGHSKELINKPTGDLFDKDGPKTMSMGHTFSSGWFGDDKTAVDIITKLFAERGGGIQGLGHSDIDDTMEGKYQGYDTYDRRGRIYKVGNDYYFSQWGVYSKEDYFKIKDEIPVIIKASGLENKKMWFELNDEWYTWEEIFGTTPKPVETELTKRIQELYKQIGPLESDFHVSGATWDEATKKRKQRELNLLKAEIAALRAAHDAGETDISKVVIKTLDDLGSEGKAVPADILYAELEKRLKHFGSSPAEILQKLKDMGVNPRTMVREIQAKLGTNITAEQLLAEIYLRVMPPEEFPNKTISLKEMAKEASDKLSKMDSYQNIASNTGDTFENFLKSFVGMSLKELLDKTSFTRLYVMNKFDSQEGDHPQQLFSKLLDATVGYINFRLIMPIRKQLDDQDAIDRATPEYQKYHREKMVLLKQIFAASKEKNSEKETALRKQMADLVDPSSYSRNMKDMTTIVKEIHMRPLSEKDVTPDETDTEDDKKRYESARQTFFKLKNRLLS